MNKGLEALKDLAMLEWLCSQKGMLFDWERIRKPLKALEIIKELFDFDFAIRFGDNQPMIKITNKRNGQYWELPETTEICDLLKEVLL